MNGGGTVLTRGEAETESGAIGDYIKDIVVKELQWRERQQEIKEQHLQGFHKASAGLRGDRDAYNTMSKQFQNDFQDIIHSEFKKYVDRAKKMYRERKPKLRVFRNTMGLWQVVGADHTGFVSAFKIPINYLNRTIHGDRPLTGRALETVYNFIKRYTGDGKADFRDRNNEFMTFDNWLADFPTKGSEYAWRDGADRMIGGRGVNPTLDEVLNGQHGGYSIFYQHKDTFMEMCQAAGYTGIEYDGGVRVGGNVRGGGGIRHCSYVFWDDDYINTCRISIDPTTYENPSQTATRGVRASSLLQALIRDE
jgi:hypothetical protein